MCVPETAMFVCFRVFFFSGPRVYYKEEQKQKHRSTDVLDSVRASGRHDFKLMSRCFFLQNLTSITIHEQLFILPAFSTLSAHIVCSVNDLNS